MKISKGSREHKFAIVLGAIRYLKELLIPLLVLFISHGFRGDGEGWELYWRLIAGGVLVAGAFVWGFLRWWWFRYRVEEGALRIEEGILVKRKISIPVGRIQTMDTSEGLLHRMLGLVKVQVQTAGGVKPEAVFTALSRAEAGRLELALRQPVPVAVEQHEADGYRGRAGHGEPEAGGCLVHADDEEPEAGPSMDGMRTQLPVGGCTEADGAVGADPAGDEGDAAWTPALAPAVIHAQAQAPVLAPAQGQAQAQAQAQAKAHAPAPVLAPRQTAVFRLPAGRLFLAGLTVNNLGVGISLLFAGLSQADDLFPGFRPFEMMAELSGPKVVLMLAAVVVFLSWLLAVGSSVVRFADFTVAKQGEDLLITRGLLERRRVTLPVRRIQAVRISQELVWRPFRLAAVHVVCAGYGNQQGESTLLFPLMRLGEIETFLRELCPEFAVDPERAVLNRLPAKAVWSYIVPLPLFLLAVSGVAWWVHPYGVWGFAAVVLSAGLGLVAFRSAGYATEQGRVLLRKRWMTESLLVVPGRRVQYMTVSRNPLQRRSGLAVIRLSLAAGPLGSHYELKGMDADTAAGLLEWTLQTRRAWQVGADRKDRADRTVWTDPTEPGM